ncbi:MAG TPA: redoxin domain-containing protein [Cyclobacteriaceae bacterium]|jgi:peroxiredoxin|nr:redoxin domain-containing protein [Cyclobacteriaceae bacterium]
MITAPQNLVVELNVTAPLFNLLDIFDRAIDLKSYKGKKVFIGFFRHAGCPFCNLRVHNLMKIREKLVQQNMEMIFFFESSKELMLQSIFHKEVSPVPLIADPQKNWYTIYGIENSLLKTSMSHLTSFIQTAIAAKKRNLPLHVMAGGESFSTMPAEFLLDENQIIRKIHYAKNLNNRMSIDAILDFASGQKN